MWTLDNHVRVSPFLSFVVVSFSFLFRFFSRSFFFFLFFSTVFSDLNETCQTTTPSQCTPHNRYHASPERKEKNLARPSTKLYRIKSNSPSSSSCTKNFLCLVISLSKIGWTTFRETVTVTVLAMTPDLVTTPWRTVIAVVDSAVLFLFFLLGKTSLVLS